MERRISNKKYIDSDGNEINERTECMHPHEYGLTLAILFVIAILFGAIFFDPIFLRPLRAQSALEQCREMGFDTYQSFSGVFRSTAYGVKCEQINERRVNINSESALPLVGVE